MASLFRDFGKGHTPFSFLFPLFPFLEVESSDETALVLMSWNNECLFATQHLASKATAALGLQPTPMLNHWLQGLPATTISVPSDSIVKKTLQELPKPTLSSQV